MELFVLFGSEVIALNSPSGSLALVIILDKDICGLRLLVLYSAVFLRALLFWLFLKSQPIEFDLVDGR